MHRLFFILLVCVTFIIYLGFIIFGIITMLNLNIPDKSVQAAVQVVACFFSDIPLLDAFKACSSDTMVTVYSSDTPVPEPLLPPPESLPVPALEVCPSDTSPPVPEPCPSDTSPPDASKASYADSPWFLFPFITTATLILFPFYLIERSVSKGKNHALALREDMRTKKAMAKLVEYFLFLSPEKDKNGIALAEFFHYHNQNRIIELMLGGTINSTDINMGDIANKLAGLTKKP